MANGRTYINRYLLIWRAFTFTAWAGERSYTRGSIRGWGWVGDEDDTSRQVLCMLGMVSRRDVCMSLHEVGRLLGYVCTTYVCRYSSLTWEGGLSLCSCVASSSSNRGDYGC